MMRKIFLAFLICIASRAGAQSRPLSLNEAVALSLQNNYDIQLSRNDSLLAALNYSYANYAFFPDVSATGGIIFNTNNQTQELANGTKRGGTVASNTVSSSVNLNWTLFDGFRMFIVKRRLNELVELGELQLKNQVIITIADVMRTYYDVVRQQQQLRAIEEQIELSNERLKLAQYKYEIGSGAKPDMLQAQIDLNGQRSALLTQQAGVLKTKELLNNLLSLPVDQQFTVSDTSLSLKGFLYLDTLRSGIEETNPQLLMAQQNLVLADLALQERKAERYPVVAFNSAYNINRTRNQNVINEITQPLLFQNRGLNYGLTATVPIFNGYTTRRNIRAAQLEIDYQQLQYKRNLAQVSTSLANTYRDYQLHRQAVIIEEENMKLVRENLFIARERYRLGVSTFLEMREAQQSLEVAMNRLIQANYNAKLAEVELMRIRGELVR